MMLATAMALAIAADVPAEGETVAPPLERGYVQMCHAKPPVPATALTERAANRAIVRAVRAAFNREWPHYRPPANMAAVDVAVRNFRTTPTKGRPPLSPYKSSTRREGKLSPCKCKHAPAAVGCEQTSTKTAMLSS